MRHPPTSTARGHLAFLARVVLLCCPLAPLSAQEIYRSVDADGHVVYSDRGSSRSAPKTTLRVEQADPAEASRIAKEQEMLKAEELERGKHDSAEAKAKSSSDHQKQVACENARSYYYRLRDSGRIYQRDSDGNRVYYSDDEADKLREQARRAMSAACGT